MRRRAWVLNFDAEDELARGTRPWPSRVELRRMEALASRLRGTLVPEGDAVVFPTDEGEVRGLDGVAWCVTPWSRRVLADRGARERSTVDPAVVARVNHRAWMAGLGALLDGARYVTDAGALDAVMAGAWPTGGWLLKRPWSYAGRGRLHLRTRDELTVERHVGWLRRSMATGGVMVEPHVERVVDLALHGWIGEGRAERGTLTRQVCDAAGAWVSTERWEVDAWWRAEVERAFDETTEALAREGYRGPFGVDGFVWRDDVGVERVQPRSDVNARYTMGWAVGMGCRRPDLE